MTSTDEQLVELLRAALAMEMRAEMILRGQAPRLRRYFQLRERVERHLQVTLERLSLFESCLNCLGAGPPAIEDLVQRIAVCAESDGKNARGAVGGYLFEIRKVAVYTGRVAAATVATQEETLRC